MVVKAVRLTIWMEAHKEASTGVAAKVTKQWLQVAVRVAAGVAAITARPSE